MILNTLITPELSLCHPNDIRSKKHVLELISKVASEANQRLRYKDILIALTERENIGSTAIGHGVAIPHAKIDGLANTLCILITLQNPIHFSEEEPYQETTDIIIGLLVPKEATEEHLNTLASLSEALRSPHFREQLRKAKTNDALFSAATTIL